MSEQISAQPENTKTPDAIAESIGNFSKRLDVIGYFRPEPTSSEQQKQLFMAGEIDQPIKICPALEQADFSALQQDIISIADDLTSINIPDKFRAPYEAQLHIFGRTADMLQAAQEYNQNRSPESRKKFMEANIEVYGEPDRDTYDGLVTDLKQSITNKNFTGQAEQVKQELLDLLPETNTNTQPYRPSPETIDWAQNIVQTIHQPFLDLIPDQDQFSPEQLKDLFATALHETMAGAADDWQVILDPQAKSIDVDPPQKIIRIPDNSDKRYSQQIVRDMMVHEIGVHALRSIMGEDTNVEMLRTGMPGYLNAEEGLGVVSEQALKGQYADRGVPYYLIAGGQYFYHQNFRQAFELIWRRDVLLGLKSDQEPSEEAIKKAKDTAYSQVSRINRGADGDLLWFKDLSYYNGNRKIWDYLEQTIDDPDAILNLYYGKVDPTDRMHMRAAWDAQARKPPKDHS